MQFITHRTEIWVPIPVTFVFVLFSALESFFIFTPLAEPILTTGGMVTAIGVGVLLALHYHKRLGWVGGTTMSLIFMTIALYICTLSLVTLGLEPNPYFIFSGLIAVPGTAGLVITAVRKINGDTN